MTAWLFLHDATDARRFGFPTDALGLQLYLEAGFTYVDMGKGWHQIGAAIHLMCTGRLPAGQREKV